MFAQPLQQRSQQRADELRLVFLREAPQAERRKEEGQLDR